MYKNFFYLYNATRKAWINDSYMDCTTQFDTAAFELSYDAALEVIHRKEWAEDICFIIEIEV